MNSSFRQSLPALVASLIIAGAGLTAVAVTAPTAGALVTYTVDNNGDGAANAANCTTPVQGACRVRDAFAAADTTNDDVEVVIPADVGDIALTTGELLYAGGVGNDETITLTGGGNTITQTTAGARVINDTAVTLFTMSGLTITGGDVGGGASGGGIFVTGFATITDSTISGNTADDSAGGVRISNGPLLLVDSTITGNTATNGAGGAGFVNGTATFVNSTITGNQAGGSIGGFDVNGSVSMVYTTFVGNTAGSTANLNISVGTFSAFGSVVALPLGGGVNCSIPATASSGFNWDDDGTCGFDQPTDHSDAGDPELGLLADNGGPTPTRLPADTSGLVNDIPTAACGDGDALAGFTVTTDQRGEPRPDPDTGLCDIGAVELQPIPPVPPGPSPIVVTPTFTG